MNRSTRVLLAAVGLGSLTACADVAGPTPAPGDRPALASFTASSDVDDMLRDARDRLTLSLDGDWYVKIHRALDELVGSVAERRDDEQARRALARALELVAAYDGPPDAAPDLAAIELALDQAAVVLGK